jgi:hypothetical protein
MQEIVLDWIRQTFDRSGWRAFGRGTTAIARLAPMVLRAAGYVPVGPGRKRPVGPMIYGPTGTLHPGTKGYRTRLYVGRWHAPQDA